MLGNMQRKFGFYKMFKAFQAGKNFLVGKLRVKIFSRPLDRKRLSARNAGLLFVLSITGLLSIGALLWILSTENVFPATWSIIFNTICTVLSVILNAWQWHAQAFGNNVAPNNIHQDSIIKKHNGQIVYLLCCSEAVCEQHYSTTMGVQQFIIFKCCDN